MKKKKLIIFAASLIAISCIGLLLFFSNKPGMKDDLLKQADSILEEAKQDKKANNYLQYVSIKIKDIKDKEVTFTISSIDTVSLTKQIAEQTAGEKNATKLMEATQKELETALKNKSFSQKNFIVTCKIKKNEDHYIFEVTPEFTNAIYGGLIKELEQQLKESGV